MPVIRRLQSAGRPEPERPGRPVQARGLLGRFRPSDADQRLGHHLPGEV